MKIWYKKGSIDIYDEKEAAKEQIIYVFQKILYHGAWVLLLSVTTLWPYLIPFAHWGSRHLITHQNRQIITNWESAKHNFVAGGLYHWTIMHPLHMTIMSPFHITIMSLPHMMTMFPLDMTITSLVHLGPSVRLCGL